MIFAAVLVRAIIETGSMFLVYVIRIESLEQQVEDDREWSQVDPEHSRLRMGHSSCYMQNVRRRALTKRSLILKKKIKFDIRCWYS